MVMKKGYSLTAVGPGRARRNLVYVAPFVQM